MWIADKIMRLSPISAFSMFTGKGCSVWRFPEVFSFLFLPFRTFVEGEGVLRLRIKIAIKIYSRSCGISEAASRKDICGGRQH